MKTSELAQVASSLLGPGFFLMEVKVSPAMPKKIKITIDGDNGVTIEDCAALTQQLKPFLDDVFEDYALEIGSPGLDNPLRLPRQYKKYIGRRLKVVTVHKETIQGRLLDCSEEGITMETTEKKKKEIKVLEFAFSQIEDARVQISFNKS